MRRRSGRERPQRLARLGVLAARDPLRSLLPPRRHKIRLGRRRMTPGRPVTFVVTEHFLDHFGLESARDLPGLKELRAEIEADGGAAHVVALDVTDYASIKSAVAHAETEMGGIDILVNNSGVSNTQKLTDVHPEDYDYVMGTNTRGAFFLRHRDTRAGRRSAGKP